MSDSTAASPKIDRRSFLNQTAAAMGQVARRVAGGLSSTSTGIGPGGAPVSGPPVPAWAPARSVSHSPNRA